MMDQQKCIIKSKDWPIITLHQQQQKFKNEVIAQTMTSLLARYPVGTVGLYKMLMQTTEREIERLQKMPWRGDPPDAIDFWKDITSQVTKGQNLEALLKKIIGYYVAEISSKFNKKHTCIITRITYFLLINLLKPPFFFSRTIHLATFE